MWNMLLATLAFAVMNIFVKQLDRIPAMETVFFRCLVAGMLCGAGLARAGVDWKGNNNRLLVARGTFGTLALFLFFVTLQNMPLATAVTIQYLSPIFTALIGISFLGEQVRARQWFFYALTFAGVLVLKGFSADVSTVYLLAGIASAFCSAVAYNLVRRLREREHAWVVVLHFQLVGIGAGLVFSLLYWVTPTAWEWVCLLMCGLLTLIGQVLMTRALQAEQIAKVSILNYTGLFYALAFSVFIFGERYSVQSLFGILLVLLGVVLSVVLSRQKRVAVAGGAA